MSRSRRTIETYLSGRVLGTSEGLDYLVRTYLEKLKVHGGFRSFLVEVTKGTIDAVLQDKKEHG